MADRFTKIQKRMEAIHQVIRDAVKPALLKVAQNTAELIKQAAPKDTGALADSITVTLGGQSTPPYSQPGGESVVPADAVAITVGNTDVRYGHLVEHGTADAPAQPFFWPPIRLTNKLNASSVRRDGNKAVRSFYGKNR